jgi:hypothetical protein
MRQSAMSLPNLEKMATAFAPLPRPMLAHLMQRILKEEPKDFAWQFQLHQANIFDRMHPLVLLDIQKDALRERDYIPSHKAMEEREITTNWLLSELSALLKKDFARSTLWTWTQRRFFEHVEYGRPDPTGVARLLTYLSLVNYYRGGVSGYPLLPVGNLTETAWWCWRQDTPDAAPVPCLSPGCVDPGESASNVAIYWSSWPGAVWDRHARWLQVGGQGAITSGHFLSHRPSFLHREAVNQFLAVWTPEILDFYPHLQEFSHHDKQLMQFEIPETLLRLALWNLSETRLKSSPSM